MNDQALAATTKSLTKRNPFIRYMQLNGLLYLFMLPGVVIMLLFNYLPMAGLYFAFTDYKVYLPITGQQWSGWENFRIIFQDDPWALQVIWNTFLIAGLKLIFMLIVPLIFALLLNEVRQMFFKRTVQTLVYLPHFLSWIIISGILLDVLSVNGAMNAILTSLLGIEPILFLGDGNWFRATLVITEVWKEFGFGAIIFLAALSGVNPALYEAAEIDGANRWKQTLHVTLPSIMPIVVVVGILSLTNILNGGFDQVFNLYNNLVMDKGDIIDTFVYRYGLLNGQFGVATAMGLFKSVVSTFFMVTGYWLAYRYAGYRIS